MARITITPHAGHVRVTWRGTLVVATDRALDLVETGHRPVLYVPRADADMALLEKTTHGSHCPFKGDASYYSLRSGDEKVDNVVWSYEQPFDDVMAIKDHLAFYPQHVEIDF